MLADVVDEVDGELLSLGAVMDLVDLCAGRAAYAYMEGPVVTVSVDRGILVSPLWKGDLVRVEARVVLVGSSSMTVEAVTSREDLSSALCPESRSQKHLQNATKNPAKSQRHCPSFTVCFSSQLTFVAIDKKSGRPFKNVPPLILSDDDGSSTRAERASKLKERLRTLDQRLKSATGESMNSADSNDPDGTCGDPHRDQRTTWMSLSDTVSVLSKQYLPRHENFGGLVFGGDILMLLERSALYCARRFSGASKVHCLALYGMHFKLPVEPSSLLLTTARVVLVRKFCMEIEVVMRVDRPHEGREPEVSHVANFTVIAYDSEKNLVPISVGLGMDDGDMDVRCERAKALMRKDALNLIDENAHLEKLLKTGHKA